MFLVLAAKAPAGVREVRRSESTGVIGNIAKNDHRQAGLLAEFSGKGGLPGTAAAEDHPAPHPQMMLDVRRAGGFGSPGG